jgi:hypothetical protein
MAERYTLPFEVSDGVKIHKCKRTITGDRMQTQTIKVEGVGSKPDYASYGPGAHPPDSMESTARLIAHEIIDSKL